jgi:hypothetical protein
VLEEQIFQRVRVIRGVLDLLGENAGELDKGTIGETPCHRGQEISAQQAEAQSGAEFLIAFRRSAVAEDKITEGAFQELFTIRRRLCMVLIAGKQFFVRFFHIFYRSKLIAPKVIRVSAWSNIIQGADLQKLRGMGKGLIGEEAIKGVSVGQGVEKELFWVAILTGNLIKCIISIGEKDETAGFLAGHP